MKKLSQLTNSVKALIAVCVVSTVVGGGALITNAMESNKRIDADQATTIALKDAGVKKSDATIEKALLKREDGKRVYEVEFHTKDSSYDYTIMSDDGTILDRDVEAIKKPASGKEVSLEAAKNVALKDAGLTSSQVKFTSAKKKTEDNQPVYDIEFTASGKEYDYTIAIDGSILEKGQEKSDTPSKGTTSQKTETNKTTDTKTNANTNKTNSGQTNSSTPKDTTNLITLAQAKNLALTDSGVAASQATFTKGKLDYEDGRPVYEIEFVTSTTEYDYDIDAKSGAVVKRKSELMDSYEQQTQASSKSYIGLDSARNIALQHAGLGSSSVTFTKTKLETEDGQPVYEIEFRQGKVEYDYTINAYTGNIMDWDKDLEDDD